MEKRSFVVKDVEYLRHGDLSLLARTYVPEGDGPFPCVVDLHGGGWSIFDRTRGERLHEALASNGISVVALDFRQGVEGAYPISLTDIHYGIRWVKANADQFKTRPDIVGATGNSTGGHQAMLISMRPEDPRYAALLAPPGGEGLDARLAFVVMLWPVINPYGRYRYAKGMMGTAEEPSWAAGIIPMHDNYWRTEEAMAEGNPMLLLERGEPAELAPAMWVQSTQDQVHNYRDPSSDFEGTESERFTANYQKAGGSIETLYFDAPMMFATAHAELPESVAALQAIADFIHKTVAARAIS
nr:alpha/beta hydrolase [Sphingomonas sp. CDS-1]